MTLSGFSRELNLTCFEADKAAFEENPSESMRYETVKDCFFELIESHLRGPTLGFRRTQRSMVGAKVLTLKPPKRTALLRDLDMGLNQRDKKVKAKPTRSFSLRVRLVRGIENWVERKIKGDRK